MDSRYILIITKPRFWTTPHNDGERAWWNTTYTGDDGTTCHWTENRSKSLRSGYNYLYILLSKAMGRILRVYSTLSGHGLDDDVTIYYLSLLLLLQYYNKRSVEKTTRFHWPRRPYKCGESCSSVALNPPNWPRCEINRFRWKRTPPPPPLFETDICIKTR